MSGRERQRLEDIVLALRAIAAHRQRGNLDDELVFDAARIRSSRSVRRSSREPETIEDALPEAVRAAVPLRQAWVLVQETG